jgi:hypothetical protein
MTIIPTLHRMCEEWHFHDVESTIDTVLENVGSYGRTLSEPVRRMWELDVMLHELAHYMVARGSLYKDDITELHITFWNFSGQAQEIATCVVAHLAARELKKEGFWPHRVVPLSQAIKNSGLSQTFKNTGIPEKIAKLMLKDHELVRYGHDMMVEVKMAHLEYNKDITDTKSGVTRAPRDPRKNKGMT